MAWEYQYKLLLNLNHPSMDPDEISIRIPDVQPHHTTKAGVPVPGRPRVPVWSVWQARLHEEEWQHSETQERKTGQNDFFDSDERTRVDFNPCPLRPIDEGLICQVIHRGNNRRDVLYKPEDFRKEREPSSFFPALS